MVAFPSLEYNLSHRHPKGQWFLLATLVIFLLALPALVLISLATQGSELVPTLQPDFQVNETLFKSWWGTGRLPKLLRPKTPLCQPRDLGRGDTFRLSNSLFDYKVMSTWNTSEDTRGSAPQKQERFEYRGESFADCYVNNTRFDWSLAEQSQTMTVGVTCPGTNPDYPIYISMETVMTFSWLLTKDFIGQYYGPGLDLLNINNTDTNDYRKLVFAVLELISQDSLTIMRRPLLSNQALSMSIAQYIDPDTRKPIPMSEAFTYVNGTATDFPAEALIYVPSTYNLAAVVADAVNLDLGSRRTVQNIFTNASALNTTIWNNTAPAGTSPASWAGGSQSFYYGELPPQYQTWALALRHGWPVQLGDPTNLEHESVMVTSYLCPTYRTKPMRSLLSSVFVGTATMTLSVWATWAFVTAFLAKRIRPPRIQCHCEECASQQVRTTGTSSLDNTKSPAQTPGIVELPMLPYPRNPPAGP